MKKFLLSALCVVTSLLASAANEADFSTMNSGKTDSGYNERTSTNGWKATNAAIVSIDNTTAPAINGNTTKKGVIPPLPLITVSKHSHSNTPIHLAKARA